ncbi:MAG: biopolymer transporter ExbD [Leptolyngbyaceae cyanobacterium bins.349]|nr:biopolymer transporter ExbD [Leptolyngbyaceae cyanobacterium bins.349]
MKIHHDLPTEEVQIQIVPLIDVIFCILTFFILAALQFTRQQAINVELPRASTGTPLTTPAPGNNADTRFREMLVVTIGTTGQTYVDKRPVDRPQLLQELQAYLARNPNGLLVLNASPSSFYNDVIQVVDLMRSVGGDRVALATLPTASPDPGASPLPPGASPLPSPTSTFDPFAPFGTPPTPGPIPGATISPLAPESGVPSPPTP